MFKHNLKAVLNTQRPTKDGRFPLRIRMTIKRVVSYHPTNLMLKKDQLVNGEVVKHPNRVLYNIEINKKISEIEKALLEHSITGQETVKLKKNASLKFTDYAVAKIKAKTGLEAKSTTKHKKSYLNKINQFKPTLKMTDVNKELLTALENHCRESGNLENTVWSCTKFVRSIINAAVAEGVLPSNPIKGFKGARYTDPMRTVLTASEVELFEGFADNPLNSAKLRSVAAWFVFGCYTGLRYSDMARFKGFVNDRVLIQTVKTSEIVSIFATPKIIEANARLNTAIFSNQKMNDYLKIIAAGLGIDKKVTVHLARHTFAVEFLSRGGRLEILSKIMGHSILKTTSIYAKISDNLADSEMRRVWDKG
jgi:integrase/recombinase XerD